MTGDTNPTTPAAVEWSDAEREAVVEAVAVHTPELVALAPDGVSEGQHLYCAQCGVLPVDALALQHGPEHVADKVAEALAPFVAERERQAAEGAAEAERDRLRAEVRKCQRLVADGLTASASALLGYLARADRIEREVQP